jgi:hypothetical protein
VTFDTFAPLMWLMTSDTVDCETPASLAMSVIVGRRGRGGLVMGDRIGKRTSFAQQYH